jgi:uncharacterized protein YqgQ
LKPIGKGIKTTYTSLLEASERQVAETRQVKNALHIAVYKLLEEIGEESIELTQDDLLRLAFKELIIEEDPATSKLIIRREIDRNEEKDKS